VSGTLDGGEIDLAVINAGKAAAARSGIPHAELLVGFADALLARDEAELARLREAIVAALGRGGLRETASIAANFQRMVRIADATGIPQEVPVLMLGGDLIDELDLRRFATAGSTPASGGVQRVLGKLLRPLVPKLIRRVGASRAKREAAAAD
jgi:hypothetical protein